MQFSCTGCGHELGMSNSAQFISNAYTSAWRLSYTGGDIRSAGYF